MSELAFNARVFSFFSMSIDSRNRPPIPTKSQLKWLNACQIVASNFCSRDVAWSSEKNLKDTTGENVDDGLEVGEQSGEEGESLEPKWNCSLMCTNQLSFPPSSLPYS